MRRALAHRLRRFTPHDLLAVEDSTLRPVPPARAADLRPPTVVDATALPRPASLRGIVLEMSVDTLPEAQRAADRIGVLLQQDGVRTEVVDRAGPDDVKRGSLEPHDRVRARLTRVPLFSEEPLLRALELRARVLPGQPLPDELRVAAQVDPREPGSERMEAAARVETSLIDDGLVIPLWTQPGLVLIDRRLGDAGAPEAYQPECTSLPLLLREARWYNLTPAR